MALLKFLALFAHKGWDAEPGLLMLRATEAQLWVLCAQMWRTCDQFIRIGFKVIRTLTATIIHSVWWSQSEMLLRIKLLVRAMILARLDCHFSWPIKLWWLRVLSSLVITHSSVHVLRLWWCRLASASIALVGDLLSEGPLPTSFIEWGHVHGLMIASWRGSTSATCCFIGTLSHHLGYVVVHMHLNVDIWSFLGWLRVPIGLLGEFSLVNYLCITSVGRQIHLVTYNFFRVQLVEICKGSSLWVHTVLMLGELLLRAVRLALISLVSHYQEFSWIDAVSVFWTFWLVLITRSN